MTRFCAGEDSWLARSNNTSRNPDTSDTKDVNGRQRRTDQSAATTVITPKIRESMPDSEALDRSCQIHGTPDKPANHTNRECWVFKQAGKLNAENKDKGLHTNDEEEPRPPNSGGQKGFPPQVKTVNMIYATHIPKRERKRALRDVYAMEPVAQKFNP